MWTDRIEKPTLILDAAKCQANLKRMAKRAQANHVRLRPHSKTHQSAEISQWLRALQDDQGQALVTGITVSSVEMASYFYKHGGWSDITIAFTVNPRQIHEINRLAAAGVQLGLLVESMETLQLLQAKLQHDVNIWLDIDTGYHRTGLDWQADTDAIKRLATAVRQGTHTSLVGLLGHAGHTYDAQQPVDVQRIHEETVQRMNAVRDMLQAEGDNGSPLQISLGDTPTCSIVEEWGKCDEMRPGNFFFYDVMQAYIGANTLDDIAVAVACVVVAKHSKLHQVVLYGGAVHLSKDRIVDDKGRKLFGRVARATKTGWDVLPDTSYVKGISQEHGLVHADDALMESVQIGDVLLVLPIHSCLTANLLKKYEMINGEHISMAPIPNTQEG